MSEAVAPDRQGFLPASLQRCQNCEATAGFEPIFPPAHQMARCKTCGGWSYLGVVTQSVEALYDSRYFSGGEYASYQEGEIAFRRNFQLAFALIERFGRRLTGSRVLELGCATGLFMERAAACGARVIGIEPSEFARGIARGRGLDVHPPGPGAVAAVREFTPNVLVAFDVWEHLRRPAEQVSEMLELCAPDAVIALSTVDAGSLVARARRHRWRQFHPPTHLHYPTRTSLRRFLHEHGFDVTYQHSIGYFRPLVAYLDAIGLGGVPLPGAVRALPVYLDLLDIQLVIAHRAAPGSSDAAGSRAE